MNDKERMKLARDMRRWCKKTFVPLSKISSCKKCKYKRKCEPLAWKPTVYNSPKELFNALREAGV